MAKKTEKEVKPEVQEEAKEEQEQPVILDIQPDRVGRGVRREQS